MQIIEWSPMAMRSGTASERQSLPYKTRLDENNAYHMALCAEAIYEKVNDGSPDEPKILELLKANDDRYLSVSGFQAGGTEAALIEHDDYLVYSFRGTDEAVDWISNLNAFPDECLGGKYHRGFYQAFDRVWPELNEAYWANLTTKIGRTWACTPLVVRDALKSIRLGYSTWNAETRPTGFRTRPIS